MSTDEVLDAAVVADLRRAQDAFGNPAFVRELVELFRSRTPGKLDQVRDALAAGDAASVERVAHALRSNCAMLGASGMAAAAARMEEAAAKGDLAAADVAFGEAEQNLPLVIKAISAL